MNLEAFGERVRERRSELRLRQKDIADRFDPPVSIQTVSQWEAGSNLPESSRLSMLADVLGVELPWLLSGEGPKMLGGAGPTGGGRYLLEYAMVQRRDGGKVIFKLVETDERGVSIYPCGPNAFILRVWDNANGPQYVSGDRMVFDPDIVAEPGDMVLIKIAATGAIAIRYFDIEDDDKNPEVIFKALAQGRRHEMLRAAYGKEDKIATVLATMTESTAPRRAR